MDAVRETMEFYYRKGEKKDYRWGLCQVKWRSRVQEKKKCGRENFILAHFYVILNLEVGKNFMLLPGGGSGWTHAHIYANSKSM
jgi:hypothetical protein